MTPRLFRIAPLILAIAAGLLIYAAIMGVWG